MADEALAKCLKEAMEKAEASRGAEGEAKPQDGPKSKKGRPQQEQQVSDDQFQTMLLRDYLNFKANARPTLASKQTVILFKSNETANMFHTLVQ